MSTYNGQGTNKAGIDASSHAIVHMEDQIPTALPSELAKGMNKEPLAVAAAKPDQKLDPMCRVNFAKIYTVEHNVKAMNVGIISPKSMPKLLGYWRNAVMGE